MKKRNKNKIFEYFIITNGGYFKSKIPNIKKTCIMLLTFAFILSFMSLNVLAAPTGSGAGADVIKDYSGTLIGLIEALVSLVGSVFFLWGLMEWGISMSSPDGTSQAMALKRIAGGLVVMLAPQIAAAMTV